MVKTFSGMGKILTSLYNHLFEILIVQLFADFFHQKVSEFDNLSRIGHLVHLLNRKAVVHPPIYSTKGLSY
jgi:hypothetical protein